MTAQQHHLSRVADNIGATVIDFCQTMLRHTCGFFVAATLREYVTSKHPHIAPDSPGRVMRSLKQRGVIDYKLISRGQSLYRVVSVRE